MQRKKTLGFSMIEIAISLAIIGLIAVSITSGIYIKNTVKLNTITKDLETINQAYLDFFSLYGNLPGDLWNAQDRFGVGVNNGNGNNIIDGNEALDFWQHLSSSGFIDETYDGATNSPGVGVMEGPFTNSGYTIAKATEDGSLSITFSAFNGTTAGVEVLTPAQLFKLDKKLDDGVPNTGMLTAVTGSGVGATDCFNGAAYSLTNDSEACCFTLTLGSVL